MNTIFDKWAGFEAIVIPQDAPPIQTQEMRRAFYAGAASMLGLLYDISDEGVSDEAGSAMMEGWRDECDLFIQQVNKGEM
jgi:hypothetical protein